MILFRKQKFSVRISFDRARPHVQASREFIYGNTCMPRLNPDFSPSDFREKGMDELRGLGGGGGKGAKGGEKENNIWK